MRIKFISYLDVFQTVRAFLCRKKYDEVYYFNISRVGRMVLKQLGLGEHVRPFEFKLWELKDSNGESRFVRIFGEDLNDAYKGIRSELCENNQFIAEFGKRFDEEKVKSFYMKYFGSEIKDIVIFINVIDWYRNQRFGSPQNVIEFAVERNTCIKILKQFSLKKYNISLKSYVSARCVYNRLFRLFGNVWLSFVLLIKASLNYRTFLRNSDPDQYSDRKPVLAMYYSLTGLTFDVSKRCDFFWLLESGIPYEQCLVYFDREDKPVTDEMESALRKSGIKYIAFSEAATTTKAVPIYRPSFILIKTMVSQMLRTLSYILKDLVLLRFHSVRCIEAAIYFSRKYSEARDFYQSFDIKVDVDSTDFGVHHIAMCLALEALGGVSVSFQRSNKPIPQVPYSSFADAYFLFGPHYLPIIQNDLSVNDTVLCCGFITDYSFKEVAGNSKALRERITSRGVEFVICYFDENSSDDRMAILPNHRSAEIYEKLLELVINDETLGMICSPKRPRTLRKRLPRINRVIEEAEATGRCLFLDGDVMVNNYPTEAAQASDLVITLLLGGTTYLESVLSGARTVCLDLEALYSYDEYKWGKETVIFDNLNNLMAAIKKFRNCPASFGRFGNSPIIQTIGRKDPFRDGRAAERIGNYIKWLIDSFGNKKTREEALEYAGQAYMNEWGAENTY